jgi:hypothetical protein
LDDRLRGHNADLFASPKEGQVERPVHDEALFEPISIDRPYQFPASYLSPRVLSEGPMPPAREEQPQASAAPPGKSELRKTGKIEPIHQVQVPRPPDRLVKTTAAERWIPPALLAAWRGGNHQEKTVLAGTGFACVLVFVLILSLAVAHISSGSRQQSTARPAASSAIISSPQTGPLRAPVSPPATVPADPDSDQPPPSLLERFAETFLGYKSEKPEIETDIRFPIDKNHVGVQVWTSKSSGYYYCTDNPYYIKVQPGTFMTQRDALQSGYQPKLGQFCD